MHKAREVAAVTIGLVEGLLAVAQDAMKCNDYITGKVYAHYAADAADLALLEFRFYANNTVWPEAADYVGRADAVVETASAIGNDCDDRIRNSMSAANKAYADSILNIGQALGIGKNGKSVCAQRLRIFRLRLALTDIRDALGVWVVTVVAVGWIVAIVGAWWVEVGLQGLCGL